METAIKVVFGFVIGAFLTGMYVNECPFCATDKCNRCDMGDDVECANCIEEEESDDKKE